MLINNILTLITSLGAIVLIAMLFCNALEHLGANLKISEGVTGSIFAAVGTALPETIIPFLAFLNVSVESPNTEIGVGAILGAPLMLSTLSLSIMAIFVIKKRGLLGRVYPEPKGLKRDLKFFLICYILAFVAAIIPYNNWQRFLHIVIALCLLLLYFLYVLLTIKDSKYLVKAGNITLTEEKLFLQLVGLKESLLTIVFQLFLAIILLVYFAELFIGSVNALALNYNISPFLLSLIIVPIATELPEKINSIIWLNKGKDTLAIGNITGALVFQGSLLPMLGIISTNWSLHQKMPLISILITLIAVLWLYYHATRSSLKVWHFMLNGVLYLVAIGFGIYFIHS